MGRMIELEPVQKYGRRTPRFKVFQPASLEHGDDRGRVHVLDISSEGARLHGDQPPPVGSYVALVCAGFTVRGRVVWSRERRFGVEFHFPLPDLHVRHIIDYTVGAGD
jgi:hypothetical protein